MLHKKTEKLIEEAENYRSLPEYEQRKLSQKIILLVESVLNEKQDLTLWEKCSLLNTMSYLSFRFIRAAIMSFESFFTPISEISTDPIYALENSQIGKDLEKLNKNDFVRILETLK